MRYNFKQGTDQTIRKWMLPLILLAAPLAGCVTTPSTDSNVVTIKQETKVASGNSVSPTQLSIEQQVARVEKAGLSFTDIGTGAVIGQSAASIAPRGPQNITLNLVNVPALDALNQVFSGALGKNYVVESPLNGNLTIQTSAPVDETTAIALLNSALGPLSAGVEEGNGYYRVVARTRNSTVNSGPSAQNVRFVQLDYIAASRMAAMLSGMKQSDVSTRVDFDRNLLVLEGDPESLDGVEEMIALFDVNWMEGMSFSATPVNHATASKLVDELNAIFSTQDGGSLAGLVKFIPIDRLNVVLTVSPQPDYMRSAEVWIDRLDRSGGEAGTRFYVMQIENRPATEVADILRETLNEGQRGSAANQSTFRPGEEILTTVSTTDDSDSVFTPPFEQARGTDDVKIFADDANNAIVIRATPSYFSLIEDAVERLDVTPNQVFLEATIAEVTLSDDLSFGLSWFFQSGEFEASFSSASNGAVANAFPGFNVLFSGSDGRAALNAVAGVTDVKVLSAPSLMVLDNRTATLQVGDQVPIVTQSAVSVTDPDAPIVNSVSLRDTGIILNVTPRVNEGGLVMLEIDQEVSDVVATQSSGIDSPTIQQRRISTSVAVHDGESIALGGLIRERVSYSKSKVPLLGDIPLLGAAFSEQTERTERTELLVLITPRVIKGNESAMFVTNSFRARMQEIEDLFATKFGPGM